VPEDSKANASGDIAKVPKDAIDANREGNLERRRLIKKRKLSES
jgi:hypothetical protein